MFCRCGTYTKAAREEMLSFVEFLKTKAEEELKKNIQEGICPDVLFEVMIEVAVVGYRDFGDGNHFETIDFTPDMVEIKEFLASLSARGGGDVPEDVLGKTRSGRS